MQVDHINGNRLDCRRSNMRVGEERLNHRNRSVLPSNNTTGVQGVYRTKSNRWEAKIECDGKSHHLGTYSTKDEAIVARRAGELLHFGEYAHTTQVTA